MKKLILLSLLWSYHAHANDSFYLIQEMETLRDSLSLDDPKRVELTLRLADLYFDVSIKEGKSEDFETLKKNRMKALALYENSLEGRNGLVKAKGLKRVKIQFQMARLLSRLEEGARAQRHYQEVYENDLTPKKMKEQAALALGEWFEEEVKYLSALKFYGLAKSLCESLATCNYVNYRLGWLHYKDNRLDEAIDAMELSLWDDQTNLRENSLNDYIMFLSNKSTDGLNELKRIQYIAKKANDKTLEKRLVEAFYVAGNRIAGSNLLAIVNEKEPSLYYEVRLIEEFYGFRNWDKVDEFLGYLRKRTSADIPTKKEHSEEVKKILRRYIVQVDAETAISKDLYPILKESIDVYLTIYPNDELRKKMQAGWLAATSDPKEKVDRLGKWIEEDIKYDVDSKDIRKLRQTRLSLAQKLNLNDIVIEESLAIAKILDNSDEANEFNYVAARQFYENEDYSSALNLFMGILDKTVQGVTPTKWATLSQNLVLDIYNKQKKFDSIIEQIAFWKEITSGVDDKDIIQENRSMDKILTEAKFEKAASLKDSPEALQSFYDFCFSGVYEEKSCANAKVLAVKLKDQKKIISLLEKEGDESALMIQYELNGLYTKAARLQEKLVLKKDPSYENYFKIALLYELDHNEQDQLRILKSIVKKVKKEKTIPAKYEDYIYATLEKADLINDYSMFWGWSSKYKLKLANRIHLGPKKSKAYKKSEDYFLSKKQSNGPVWSKLVLAKVEKIYRRASRVKFYGRNSKSKFKRRTRDIKYFVNKSKPWLDGADLETRIYILHMLSKTYENMVHDITNTPIPDGLDEETLKLVQSQIQTMAQPFIEVRDDYQRLLAEQMSEINEEELKSQITSNLASDIKSYAELITLDDLDTGVIAKNDFDVEAPVKMKRRLLDNPDDIKTLKQLKTYYESQNALSLAGYYKDRLSSLSGVNE